MEKHFRARIGVGIAMSLLALVLVVVYFGHTPKPETEEERLARYEELRPLYPSYDLLPPNLEISEFPKVENYFGYADLCVVAEVVVGMDKTEPFTVTGEELFGDEDKDLVDQYRSDGLLADQVRYSPYTIKVDEYIINKNDETRSELTVMYGLMVQDYGIKAKEGMKLLMFLSQAKAFPDKYFGSTFWAYFITEDGYIVPAMTDEIMEKYAAMKLEDYIKILKDEYQDYVESVSN